MGKCAYTWEEWNEEKQEYTTRKCLEEIWEETQDFCIFHEPSPEKDTVLFEQKLREKLEKKDYNFRGCYFLENTDFSRENFEDAAFFDGATFQGASFDHAVFKMVSFNKTILNVVSLFNVTFENASFNHAVFSMTSFNKANLKNVSFDGAIFRDITFNEAIFESAFFRGATFQGAYFEGAHFGQDTSFTGATFQQYTSFRGAHFSQTYFADTHIRCNVNFEDSCFRNYVAENDSQNALLERGYRTVKNLLNLQGDYTIAGEFYYREMEAKRCRTRNLSRLWLELYKWICGYGERPVRVVGASLVIILLGAVLFLFCGVERFDENTYATGKLYAIQYPFSISGIKSVSLTDFGYCTYYSVITFTTLGYGDIHPLGYSHFFAAIESFVGAFFIALFVVVFTRKMMR